MGFSSWMLTHGLFQASEMASVIVTQRDLGCQATGVVHLDEGVNTDSLQAEEFWNLLGGQTQYKGKRHYRKCLIINTFIPQNCSNDICMFVYVCFFLQVQTVQMMMSTMREPYQSQTVFIGCRGTDSVLMSRAGQSYQTSVFWTPLRSRSHSIVHTIKEWQALYMQLEIIHDETAFKVFCEM